MPIPPLHGGLFWFETPTPHDLPWGGYGYNYFLEMHIICSYDIDPLISIGFWEEQK